MKLPFAMTVAVASLAGAASAFAQDVVVKPQQTVQFKSGAYGCTSKDKLDAVTQHDQAGEHQQMQEYFSGYQCLSTPEHQAFRVVRVIGHDVEFANSGNNDDQGLWISDRFIRQ